MTDSQKIIDKVRSDEIKYCCISCAKEHRDKPVYDGIFSFYTGLCPICNDNSATIASAKKLFGLYKMI